jgi:GT2 family glycosyltransferase
MPDAKAGVVALVVNFNTAQLTRRCTHSLLDAGIGKVLVLDNASEAIDYTRLSSEHESVAGVQLIRSEKNLGFAEGCNLLIDEALRDAACQRVLLLNSDAIAEKAGLAECLRTMDDAGFDLMGGRMLKPGIDPSDPEAIDSLGIAMYKSLLASNRKSPDDAYLGPTGGFAVYSRRFLEDVIRTHGYVFDASYFCYAEDTDLCIRARLLGARVGYTDRIVAYHEGQASRGGQYDEFILYHGIRNSIWTAMKSLPTRILLMYLPWVLVLHAAIIVRHVARREWKTTFRLYRDAFRGLPEMLEKRRVVQSTRRTSVAEFRAFIDRKFYEPRFVKGALKELFAR